MQELVAFLVRDRITLLKPLYTGIGRYPDQKWIRKPERDRNIAFVSIPDLGWLRLKKLKPEPGFEPGSPSIFNH